MQTLSVVLLFSLIGLVVARKGLLELDAITFPKVVDGKKDVLVSFQEYSWKEPTDYSNVAEEFRADSPIVAKVDCSDSKDLKEQYKIDSYPTVMCFLRGQEQPIKFEGEPESESLIDFFRSCMSPATTELRQIAAMFVASSDKATLLNRAELIVASTSPETSKYAGYFTLAMKKIIEKGDSYIQTEKERLSTLIDNPSTKAEKTKEFKTRINVLNLFA